MNPLFYLFGLKTAIAIAFLTIASFYDLKDRIIPDKIWLVAYPISVFLTLWEYFLLPFDVYFAVIQTILVAVIAGIAFIIGMGGADLKALVFLAILFPRYPVFGETPLLFKGVSLALATLLNASLLTLVFPGCFVFLRNIIKRNWKLGWLIFIGYEIDAEKISKNHLVLEYVDEDGFLRRSIVGLDPEDAQIDKVMTFKRKILVTPAIPFIVYILIGFILSIVVGDLLSYGLFACLSRSVNTL